MEATLAIVTGLFVAASLFLLLSGHFVRVLFGIAVVTNAVNLGVFLAGRLVAGTPPVLTDGTSPDAVADPVPQALVLTAIVIAFAVLAAFVVLALCAFARGKSDSMDEAGERSPAPPDLEY